MLQRFDELSLTRRLQPLSRAQVLAFGCACAGRLVWSYERFIEEARWGSPEPLGRALGLLWAIARGQRPPPPSEFRALADDCEAQTPSSDAFGSVFTTPAQDAVFATCSLLDYCIEGKAGQVVLAARYPTDSVDLYVQELERMDPRAPDLEDRILSHCLMQQELRRQDRDLAALEAGGDRAVEEIFSRRLTEAALKPTPAA